MVVPCPLKKLLTDCEGSSGVQVGALDLIARLGGRHACDVLVSLSPERPGSGAPANPSTQAEWGLSSPTGPAASF